MNIRLTQSKLIRVLFFLPTAYFLTLTLASLFIPYQPNPRYYPLPIHLLLYTIGHALQAIFLLALTKKYHLTLIAIFAILIAAIYGFEMWNDLHKEANIFSATSWFMPHRGDVVMKIVTYSLLLSFFKFWSVWKSDSQPKPPLPSQHV